MKFTIQNVEDIPEDLPPGQYCCRIVTVTWAEISVEFLNREHQYGDCLIQLDKEPEGSGA